MAQRLRRRSFLNFFFVLVVLLAVFAYIMNNGSSHLLHMCYKTNLLNQPSLYVLVLISLKMVVLKNRKLFLNVAVFCSVSLSTGRLSSLTKYKLLCLVQVLYDSVLFLAFTKKNRNRVLVEINVCYHLIFFGLVQFSYKWPSKTAFFT